MTDRYRIHLELAGDVPAGRLAALLAAIDRAGSIRQACRAVPISYRHALRLLQRARQRTGEDLVETEIGGAGGGGARLTDAGRRLLVDLRGVHRSVERAVRERRPGAAPGREADPGGDGAAPRSGGAVLACARPLLVASSIDPIETGLLPELERLFQAATGRVVRHIAAGTGQALELARDGRADLVIGHAPAAEAEFIAQGYGLRRVELMENDFLLLGPAADPARAAGRERAAEALLRIARAREPFISRGDGSGTHLKELELWREAGVTPGGAPRDARAGESWYQAYRLGSRGNAATTRFADERRAYALVDRATYLTLREEIALQPLVQGDPALRNVFSAVLLNPEQLPHADLAAAEAFVAWLTGPQGRAAIASFGVDRYGEPLFRPVARRPP